MNEPRRIDKLSLSLGVYGVVFLWSGSSLIASDSVQSFSYVVDVVFTVGSAVMAIWTVMCINRRATSSGAAHIDTEGVYASLRCSDCDGHLVWIEHGHDLTRLGSARDGHECSANAQVGGGS